MAAAVPHDDLSGPLAAGDQGPLDALFQAAGLPTPVIQFDPSPEAVPTEALRFLLDHCRQMPQAHGLPLLDGVDVANLRPALGYMTLLDVVDDGRDFRYRVFGTRLSQHLPYDLTGKCVSDNPNPTMARYFVALGQAIVARRVPVLARHVPPPNVEVEYWQRLAVPLVDQAGVVRRLLNGNVAGPWRRPAPA